MPHIDGRRKHPLYGTWINMRYRCRPDTRDARHYADRGITVCQEWQDDFWAFVSYMGERPPGMELDRIDNDGNYEPGNVRWATRQQQVSNRRRGLKVQCPAGHSLAEYGFLDTRGRKGCRACRREQNRAYRRRRAAA